LGAGRDEGSGAENQPPGLVALGRRDLPPKQETVRGGCARAIERISDPPRGNSLARNVRPRLLHDLERELEREDPAWTRQFKDFTLLRRDRAKLAVNLASL
jgi:hypothetical protein